MKLKINFFQKIFIFSVAIVIFTVLIGYILNIFFLDEFYLYRKKENMLKVAEKTKILVVERRRDELEEYKEDLRDKEGIDISILKERNKHMRRKEEENVKEGFNVATVTKAKIKLLIYSEKLPDGRNLTLRTSLSVMNSHKHELSIFNVLTTVVSVMLSMLVGRIFSKRITMNIEKLNEVTRKISVLDFSEKADVQTGDEIEELSKNIDIMSNNLNLSIENLKSFASNASHELRTPITVISTHAQALVNGIVKEEQEQRRYSKVILKESAYMNDLVGNLLTISRLSSPGIKLNMKDVSFNKILKESIEKYEILELEKDIEWDIDILDTMINCDEKIFKIAVDNIVHNALKYSPNNEIIRVYREENKIVVENSIKGNLDNTDNLCEPFTRGENAKEEKIDGNGLGLSIVKKIMELNKIDFAIIIEDKKFKVFFDIFRS
jgi:two-component system sensor histidine kinase VanS